MHNCVEKAYEAHMKELEVEMAVFFFLNSNWACIDFPFRNLLEKFHLPLTHGPIQINHHLWLLQLTGLRVLRKKHVLGLRSFSSDPIVLGSTNCLGTILENILHTVSCLLLIGWRSLPRLVNIIQLFSMKSLINWQIGWITCDNASNNDTMIEYLTLLLHKRKIKINMSERRIWWDIFCYEQ